MSITGSEVDYEETVPKEKEDDYHMKKFLRSKGFPITILSVSCIDILATCWLVGRDTKTAFLPDEKPAGCHP